MRLLRYPLLRLFMGLLLEALVGRDRQFGDRAADAVGITGGLGVAMTALGRALVRPESLCGGMKS